MKEHDLYTVGSGTTNLLSMFGEIALTAAFVGILLFVGYFLVTQYFKNIENEEDRQSNDSKVNSSAEVFDE